MEEKIIIDLINQLNDSIISMLNEIQFYGITEHGYSTIKAQVEISEKIIEVLKNELNRIRTET